MSLVLCEMEIVITVSSDNMNSVELSTEKPDYTECIPAMNSKPVHM